jgi:glycosyltransferase involved in cell wall biosynthesis
MIAIISVTQGHGSGAETVLAHLLGFKPGNQEIIVVAPKNSYIEEVAYINKFPFVTLPTTRNTLASNWVALLRTKSDLANIRLIHAWTARCFDSVGLLGRCLDIPVLGTLHDHPRSSIHSIPRQRIMRWSANRFKGLVCVSKSLADACVESRWQVPIQVIHNGLHDLSTKNLRADSAISIDIGFLGMNAPWKGFNIIREWVSHLSTLPVKWHLYGDVHEQVRVGASDLCRRYQSQVHVHGRQPVQSIFGQIDLLVHTSTEFDPFPTVLIEAARAGIPVVASNLGGASEIVAHGQTGFLFAPDQPNVGLHQLQLLVCQPLLRKHIGQSARQRFLTDFHVEKMAIQYTALWQRYRI